MIHIAETLSVHTVEDFLNSDEVRHLNELMDRVLAQHGRDFFDSSRTSTIHEVPGLTSDQARALYEPSGRVELCDIPAAAEAVLNRALDRNHALIRRNLPSVEGHRPWVFLEYQNGQHVSAHADGIAPRPDTWPRQIAAASVSIELTPDDSGRFYIETSGSEAPWTPPSPHPHTAYAPGMRFVSDGTDGSSAWFSTMKRTRWTVQPAVGTLLVFGSQLIHGTDPVRAGRVRKFLTLLTAEAPSPEPL
ncbi:hypothetical protein [Actinomadura harenae]|uniref:Fe2OG dioxygenase domain-containing protein n=1 Tax=Actinomadura harenae TaxID=2483351 RepID=A0A3M2LJ84_9ACTN|nr:hypothetical protein [Actinomadura harenae]RMI37511.1 hypothetical protein EBO15_35715 [Actinomadura harenae]